MSEYLCIKLKELRLEQGYSQEKLASLMKISKYRLNKLEKLSSTASLYELLLLSYFLKAGVNYITGESSIRLLPDTLVYGEEDAYIKKHEKIKKKNKK